MESHLEQMEDTIANVSFDEFAFLAQELKENPTESYDFKMHMQLLHAYKQKVKVK